MDTICGIVITNRKILNEICGLMFSLDFFCKFCILLVRIDKYFRKLHFYFVILCECVKCHKMANPSLQQLPYIADVNWSSASAVTGCSLRVKSRGNWIFNITWLWPWIDRKKFLFVDYGPRATCILARVKYCRIFNYRLFFKLSAPDNCRSWKIQLSLSAKFSIR